MWYKTRNFSIEIKFSLKEADEIKDTLLKLGAKRVFTDTETHKANGNRVLDCCVKYLEDLDDEIMTYLSNHDKVHFYRF